MLGSSYQGVKRLFVLTFDNATVNNQVSVYCFKKYFFSRVKIENATSKMMEMIFIISQLMTQSNNTTKPEKYKQARGMIIKEFVY